MLRSSSHLTKACGQSHYKKFWLMQTQTDNQDNCNCVTSPSVLSFPAALAKGSDGKISGIPASRSFAIDMPPQGRAAWCAVGTSDAGSGGMSNSRRSILSFPTCVESTTPQQLGASSDLFRLPSEGCLCADTMDTNDKCLDADEPKRCRGLCVSHSVCVSSSPTLFGSTEHLPNDSTSRETGFSEAVIPAVDVSSGKCHAEAFRSGKVIRDSETVNVHAGGPSEEYTCSTGSDSCVGGAILSDDSAQEDVLKAVDDSPCMSAESKHFVDPGSCFSQSISNFYEPRRFGAIQKRSQHALAEQREEYTLDPPALSNGRNILRTCKLCGTTKTPLWRSGPQGPKSLCNACGIRFKKLKKSQVAGDCSYLDASSLSAKAFARSLKRKAVGEKEIVVAKGRSHQRFKRSKLPTMMVARKNIVSKVRNEESPGSAITQVPHMVKASQEFRSDADLGLLQSESGLTSVFAADVKEAAILLMALSCGLVLS